MNDTPHPFAGASALKLALMAKRARAEAAQALQADPIAIVGMACRLPGGADTPDRFWRLMLDGVCAVADIPPDRWNGEAWYDPDLSSAGKTATKSGAFLDRIDGFDADYFGIPAREAARMDPQQRLFLEVAIEALDDAGLSERILAGSRTGVFVASYHNDYAQFQYNDPDAIDLRTLTGTLHSVLANRLSYFLDLRGPSISVDTACSASLVAIHLACQSLRLGESNTAIAGGVSLMIAPELLVSMSKVGFMAPDGRCKPFDALADGFGRGEGCSLVVLKRLSDAIADADRILAVIRGSAVNQDGHSTLLTAPSGPAQRAVIREALANAQLSPDRIGFVETHGTGTALGDPIEVEAIAATIGRPFPGGGRCLLGSVKANLGHLEAAAGASGLVKAVLALQHQAVPPQASYHSLNPHIVLAGTRLDVPTTLTPWPAGAVPRVAAVSSFGIGGTNAHAVIEEAPRLAAGAQAGPSPASADPCWLLPLSAKSAAALRDQAQAWVDFLADDPRPIADLCHTASQRRTHHDFRLAVVGRSHAGLRERLEDHLAQKALSTGSLSRSGHAGYGLGFVFGGQGSQWHAMGQELLVEELVFHDVMAEIDSLLRPLSGWSLLDALAMPVDRSRLDETECAQPALFAIQAALAALWRSWGVSPDAVVGHSVGEIAALHVAGVLSLEEAVRVVWHRGQIMNRATGHGRMASVDLSEAEAIALVTDFDERLSIAAVNAPNSVVLSGEPEALESALARLDARGVSHRRLPVQYAFHSVQMTALQPLLVDTLAGVRGRPAQIPIYSTVSGERADDTVFDAGYFARNMRQTVRFAKAIGAMSDGGCKVLVELSPHPALGHSIVETLAPRGSEPVVLASLRRGRPERETLMQACAGLYAAGFDLDWKRVQPGGGSVTSLPGYSWQRRRFWIRPRPTEAGDPLTAGRRHPLVGRRISVAGMDAHVFEGGSRQASSWLADHRVFGRLLLPAAAMMEMLASTVSEAMRWPQSVLSDFVLLQALPLPELEAGDARWQVVVRPLPAGCAEVRLYGAAPETSGAGAEWLPVAAAVGRPGVDQIWVPTQDERRSALQTVPVDRVYDRFQERGVMFGPAFKPLDDVRLGDGVAEAWAELPVSLEEGDDFPGAHPVLIDAALQLCWLAAAYADAAADLFLPVSADRIFLRPGRYRRLRVRARLSEAVTGSSFAANVLIETAQGEPVVSIERMRFARADQSAVAWATKDNDLYAVAWMPAPSLPPGKSASGRGVWLVFADADGGTADSLAAEIQAAGGSCHLVRMGSARARVAEREWVVDPGAPDHYRWLLEELDSAGAALAGVVHCWSLDMTCGDQTDPRHLERDDLTGAGSLLHLLQRLASRPSTCPTYVLTRGAQDVTGAEAVARLQPRAAGLWGLAGSATLEHPELGVRLIDLDPSEETMDGRRLLTELLERRDARIALRGHERWVPRLQRHATATQRPSATGDGRPLQVSLVRPGSLDGIELTPLAPVALQPGEVRLRVLSAGINFRDVLTVLQMYPGPTPPIGIECAGVVIEVGSAVGTLRVGDRVFGFAPASLATEAVAPAAFLARIPDGIPAEDAAGIAIAFLTAHYGLHRLAGLHSGQRILVHAAAGGVGLAAVQLAQRCGAKIFATAGSDAKRDLLRRLGVTHVMDSRTLAFADQVLAETGGKGVDVVLNALSGEFIPAGLRVLAPGGSFLELGKRGVWTAEDVAAIRPDVAYYPYDLGSLVQSDHTLLQPMYESILAALADGSLRPLPVTVFPLARVADALRYMAQARHVGKVVVQAAADDGRGGSTAISIPAAATYWITGGLGALGLDTADWLIRSGARYLVLTGRGAPSAAAALRIRNFERLGAFVRVFQADAADSDRARSILREIDQTMPPLRGVVHAAGSLHDAVLTNQRWDEAREVLRGKVHGAWLLHTLTRDLPLDFFILYSAAGVVLGAPGQGLYPAANAELDALARFRRRLGLKALSVAWGRWSGAGMAFDLAEHGQDVWKARGLRDIDPAEGFVQLQRLLADHTPYGAVIPIDWRQFLRRLPSGADRDFFAAVAPVEAGSREAVRSSDAITVSERLRALPSGLRRPALLAHLTERVRALLDLDSAVAVGTKVPLKEIGLDSLMAVEMRNVLVHLGGKPLPTTLLFDHPTLDALSVRLGGEWGLEDDGEPVREPADRGLATSATNQIAELSEEDAESLLEAELTLTTEREHT
jgi:acyl transferase domain-containing protein/NADPH:quinone reductase-like Zn-dependent oxidoreductase